MKNVGFTLAEVLITLSIIGVVAAITMPVLIQKHREHVTVNRLLKAYSVVSNAFQMAVQEKGEVKYWYSVASGTEKDENGEYHYTDATYQNMNAFYNNLAPYLKVISVKEANSTNHTDFYLLNGTLVTQSLANTGALNLADGTSIIGGYLYSICNESNGCGDFAIDINGINTLPNTIGKDIFYFVIFPNKIVPMGTNGQRENLNRYCNTSADNDSSGFGCTGWIIQKKNMDYLKRDISNEY